MDEFDFSRLDGLRNEAPNQASQAKETLAMFQMGLDRHKSGDLRSAASVYEEVLRRDPKNAEALHLLGLVAYQAGQPVPAIDFMSQAIALSPEAAPMYGNRGLALAAAGRQEEALADFSGVSVTVSHDRYFLDRLCTHMVVMHGGGRVQLFEGGNAEYEAWAAEAARLPGALPLYGVSQGAGTGAPAFKVAGS